MTATRLVRPPPRTSVSLRGPDAFKKRNPVLRQAMRAGALTQKLDVTQRRIAVLLLAFGNVGDDLERSTVDVFCVGPEVPIARARHVLGRVEPDEVATRQLIKHAPDLGLSVGTDIGGRCHPDRSTIKIEAKPVAEDAASAPFL